MKRNLPKGILLIAATLFFTLILANSAYAAEGDVIYVNGSSGSDDNDGFTPATAKLSIKNATGTVNSNGLVNIANGQYNGTNNTGITLEKNMVIKGESQANTIINGTNTNWIFNIKTGVSVLIQNLTFTNGNSTDLGGAIINNGTLIAENCTFTSNNGNYGGAISNFANLDIVDCSFTNNTAEYGGALINFLYSSSDSIINTITNCSFTNNTAESGGGAISNIIIYASGSIINNISNCSFINNTASSGGGAISNGVLGAGSVINTVNGCNFTTNTAIGGGGAISNGQDSDLIVNNCNFTNNLVIEATGQGWATYNSGGAIANHGNLTVNSCTFTNNSLTGANTYGGAISNIESTCAITDSTFTDNTANYGGAISSISGSTWQSAINTITNCTFTSNNANYGGAVANYLFVPVFGSGSGSVISTVTDSKFTENTATYHGGAIANICDPSTTGYVMSTVTGSNFTGNTAMDAAAISNVCTLALGSMTSTVSGCTFDNNSATGTESYGGIISNISIISAALITSNVNKCDFTNNTASLNGGAILNYINGGFIDCSVTDCKFINNVAAIFGGAIFNGAFCNLTVTNGTFTNNQARDGGAIATGGNCTISYSDFTNNTANGEGGAISNYWCNFTLTKSNLIGNTATNGGAIYCHNSTVEIHFNRIVKNIANNNGTALYCYNHTVNATNNWWGNNSNPMTIANLIYVESCSVYANPWVILTVNATPNTINNGETSMITADLNHINGGDLLSGGQIPDGFITLEVPWGSLNNVGQHSIMLNTINGAITPVTFFANEGPAPSSVRVNAIADSYTTDALEAAYININKVANLTVTKTGPIEATAGTKITYTITVTNNGPDPAENVQIIDNIPPILQGVSHDSFNLGNIPAGESRTIHINGTIPSSTLNGTTFQNNATATSDTLGNITPSPIVTTTVDTIADVDLTKIVDKTRPNVGEIVLFTVTAHNNGPSDATNILIHDIMPHGFSDVGINPSKGNYSGGIWALNLSSGETATLSLMGKVTAIIAGKNTTNSASIINQTQTDPDTIDSVNATIYVPKADLYLHIRSSNNNPTIGEFFTVSYKLGNYGPDNADEVTVTIPLPKRFEISNISGDGTWNYSKNTNTITWILNTVEVGDPYLHITGKNNAIGNSSFNAHIDSATYNTNTEGVTPLIISTDPIKNTTVNATSTVSMQNTGIPLNYLIMAILLIISGLVVPKRK